MSKPSKQGEDTGDLSSAFGVSQGELSGGSGEDLGVKYSVGQGLTEGLTGSGVEELRNEEDGEELSVAAIGVMK